MRIIAPHWKLSTTDRDVWPFTDSATISAALLVWFWVGIAIGFFAAKGELL